MQRIAKSLGSNTVYTRYADDIFFSTDRKGVCSKFLEKVDQLFKKTSSPSLRINRSKTAYLSRKNQRRVTGLIICPDGKISIGRKKKRMISSLLFRYQKGVLEDKEIASLRGYISYVNDVEPAFINALALKYKGDVFRQLFNNKER